MAKLSILAGSTNKLIHLFFQNGTATNGAGLTGLTGTSTGLLAYYLREGGTAAASITTSLGTLGAYSATGGTGGALTEVDSTHMSGLYEFSVPNAAIAAGAKSAVIMFQGAANLAPCVAEIELTAWDNQNSTTGGLSGVAIDWSAITKGTAVNDFTNTTFKNVDGTVSATVIGTAAANLVAVAGTALPAQNIGGVPIVDMSYIRGGTSSGAASYVGIDWASIRAGTASNDFTNTTFKNIDGTVSATFGGTAAANVVAFNGTALPAQNQPGVPLVDIGYVRGTTNAGVAGYMGVDWSAVTRGTAVLDLTQTTIKNIDGTANATLVGTAAANIVAVNGTAATSAVGGALDVNAKYIGTSAVAATQIGLSGQKIGNGTVGNGSTTTSIVTSSTVPTNTAANQFKGRIVIFDKATTTANLRGQATSISSDDGAGTLTVVALTDAPVSGDTFTIT